jgi:ABC-type branched-subunit amino acid transport system substrate-binding protein
MRDGITAAFSEWNRRNTAVKKVVLKLISYDDAYDPPTAQKNTNTLIQKDKVFAILGSIGKSDFAQVFIPHNKASFESGTPTSQVAAPIAVRNKVPFIGALTGANLLREPFNPNLINVRASYDDETAAMVNYLVSEKLIDKISILYQNDSFGYAGLSGLTRSLRALNLKLESNATYERNTMNVDRAVDDIYKGEPHAIVMIGTYAPLAKFVKECKSRPDFVRGTLFLTVSFVNSDSFMKHLGNDTEDVIVTQVVPPPSNTSIPLVKSYQSSLALYNASLKPTFSSLEGYLVGRFIGDVLERMEHNVTQERFKKTVFQSSVFRIDGMRLGPYFYNKKFNPNAIDPERDGCNQGMRNIWITAFNQTQQRFEELTSPYSFYATCKGDPKAITFPVVFASICSDEERGFRFSKGVQAAFQSKRAKSALSGFRMTLINVHIPAGHSASQVMSSIPWFQHIVGYIGNEGLITANRSFIEEETAAGKIFLGTLSGESSLYRPFNQLIMNVRASMRDETYAIAQHLIHQRRYEKLTLVTDSSSEAVESYNIVVNELQANGLFLHQHVSVFNYSGIPELFHDAYPARSPPHAIIIVGRTASVYSVVNLLSTYDIPLVFTSLNTVEEIRDMTLNRTGKVLFTSPITTIPGNEGLAIMDMYKNDYQAIYTADKDPTNDLMSFEGYVLGSIATKVVSRITTTINGISMSDQFTSVRSFDIGGIKLGPYSNLPCTTRANDLIFGCECNQGMRAVSVYGFNDRGKISLEPEGKVDFVTCGALLTDGST